MPGRRGGGSLGRHGQVSEHARLHVHRVFITDDFKDMMPSYFSFVKAVTCRDDPLINAPRETLQWHKVLKVIRRILDMVMGTRDGKHSAFWSEFSTNVRLSVTRDTASLTEYGERMKDKQEHIFYTANGSAGGGDNHSLREGVAGEGVRGGRRVRPS